MKNTTLQKPSTTGNLIALARAIRDRESCIAQLKGQTLDKAAEALREVFLQGADLLAAKELMPHGQWVDWLGKNCPVSVDTAQTYMRLASNTERARFLMEAGSIRQALHLLKCFPEAADTEPAKPGRSWPPYLEAIYRFDKVFKYVSKNPLADWPVEGRDKLKEDLRPIVEKLWAEELEDAGYRSN